MENQQGSWELQKENIQPLSSGRKVSLLTHSLETSKNMTDYELELDAKIKAYETTISTYRGNDPIEPWIPFLHFLENSCVLDAKKKVQTALFGFSKTFYANPEHNNDKRFVELYLRCMNSFVSEKRIIALRKALFDDGVGRTVSEMFIAIAELEESLGKDQQAIKTLRDGLQKKAEPTEKLQDALHQMEYRVAQRLAEATNSEEVGRNFGSSVPVYGKSNDAPAFRSDLPPACPFPIGSSSVALTNIQQQQGLRPAGRQGLKTLVFEGISEEPETNKSPMEVTGSCSNCLSEAEIIRREKENRLRPSKWNKPEVAIVEDDLPRPAEVIRERLQLFTEDDERRAVPSFSQQTVLPDRACDASTSNSTAYNQDRSSANSSVTKQVLVCKKAIMFNGKEVSFEHRHMEAWLRKHRDTKEAEKAYGQLSNKQLECQALANKLKQKELECQTLIQKLEEAEQEHRNVISQASQSAKMLEKYKMRIAELESSLQATQCRLEKALKENATLSAEKAENILMYKEKIEELTSLIELHKTKAEELEALLEEEKSKKMTVSGSGNSGSSSSGAGSSSENTIIGQRDDNVKPTGDSVNITFFPQSKGNFNASVRMGTTYFVKDEAPLGRTHFNADETRLLENEEEELSAVDVSELKMPPPMISRKLPFTLYETQMESMTSSRTFNQRSLTATAPSSNGNMSGFAKPVPVDYKSLPENLPNRDSLGHFAARVNAIEAVEAEVDRRGGSHVEISLYQPNTDTQAIQATGINLEDSAFIPPFDAYGNALYFEDSNLTRALAMHPTPLLNSTPERKTYSDENEEYESLNNVGNFIHTRRLPQLPFPFVHLEDKEGPMSPQAEARFQSRFPNHDRTCNDQATSLSPIQETSKENRSSCTTGSSSGNMTSNRGISTTGVSMYNSTRSVSGGPKSVSRFNNFH